MAKAFVDVIIINWNTKDLLETLLATLADHESKHEVRCIVVDNGSGDGSAEMVALRFPDVKLIGNDSNLGYAKAANQAIEASDGEYVFLLNSDTEVGEEAIDAMVSFMEQHAKAAAVGPKLINTDGSLQYSCRRFPSIGMGIFHAILGLVWKANPYTKEYKMQDWDHTTLKAVDWISGAAIMLRRSAIEEIGLFDERYFMYVEDVDLCWRIEKGGWQVFYYPKAEVLHHIAKSSQKRTARMIVEHHRSIYRFYRKKSKSKWSKLLAPFLYIGLIIRSMVVVVSNKVNR